MYTYSRYLYLYLHLQFAKAAAPKKHESPKLFPSGFVHFVHSKDNNRDAGVVTSYHTAQSTLPCLLCRGWSCICCYNPCNWVWSLYFTVRLCHMFSMIFLMHFYLLIETASFFWIKHRLPFLLPLAQFNLLVLLMSDFQWINLKLDPCSRKELWFVSPCEPGCVFIPAVCLFATFHKNSSSASHEYFSKEVWWHKEEPIYGPISFRGTGIFSLQTGTDSAVNLSKPAWMFFHSYCLKCIHHIFFPNTH